MTNNDTGGRNGHRVAFYARVSTDRQDTENQLTELRRVADARGWPVAGEYVDEAVSGAKGRDQRPQFDALLKDAVRRKFDLVAVWALDRLGRNAIEMHKTLEVFDSTGVAVFCHQEGVDTTTPMGRMVFTIMSAVAEAERQRIRERIMAGLDRARAKGKKLGRARLIDTPEGREIAAKVHEMHAAGVGKKKIAHTLGIGNSTVANILKDYQKADEEIDVRGSGNDT